MAATAYYDNSVSAAKYATHYSYDFHGNVDRMYQQLNTLQPAAHRTKTIEYDYDLVSGNVHPVK